MGKGKKKPRALRLLLVAWKAVREEGTNCPTPMEKNNAENVTKLTARMYCTPYCGKEKI